MIAGKSSGLKRTLTVQSSAVGKVHSSLGEIALPAVYVSDETGCLSPVTPRGPRSARRSADMSAQFRTVKSSDMHQFSPLSKEYAAEPGKAWHAKIEAKSAENVASRDGSSHEQRISDEGLKTHPKSLTGKNMNDCINSLISSSVGIPSSAVETNCTSF